MFYKLNYNFYILILFIRIRHFEFKLILSLKEAIEMFTHLTKREKQKKLALARKRAIIWSTKEQTKRALKKTTSSTTLTTSPIVNEFIPSEPIPHINSSADIATTIRALEQSIDDLQIQRYNLDITISVLQQRLETLLQEQNLKPQAK